jgi:hypothetical protein
LESQRIKILFGIVIYSHQEVFSDAVAEELKGVAVIKMALGDG